MWKTQDDKPERGRSNRKLPTPFFVKDKPNLDIALIFYWDSFYELATERMVEGGSIPYSAIVKYSEMYGIDDFESFLIIIRKMDQVVLRYQRDSIPNRP